jgi:hypothetical protein
VKLHAQTGGVCCVDSAFMSTNVPYLLRSAQDPHNAKTPHEIHKMSQATSLRQGSEWGMRAIQGAFPRLTEAIKYETRGERRRVLN